MGGWVSRQAGRQVGMYIYIYDVCLCTHVSRYHNVLSV